MKQGKSPYLRTTAYAIKSSSSDVNDVDVAVVEMDNVFPFLAGHVVVKEKGNFRYFGPETLELKM